MVDPVAPWNAHIYFTEHDRAAAEALRGALAAPARGAVHRRDDCGVCGSAPDAAV